MKIKFILLILVLLLGLQAAHAQQSKSTPSNQDRIYTVKEVDVKAKIKRPADTPQPGHDCLEFDYPRVVVLKVVLHKSGIVSDVAIIKKSGCSYDNDAIRVAHKIEFVPAKKDGQDVSQYLTVEYAYEKP